MALYSAGKVGVDIVPDTDNFWKILNAELHSRHPEVTVDVNTKGVAKAQSQLDRLDGRTLTNVVKIEGDDSGLRKLRKEYERIQREWENKPVVSHFNIDDSSYGRDLDKLRNKNRKAASDVRKNWLDNTLGTLADIRQEQKKYEEEADKLYRKRDKLLAKLEDGSKRSAKETKSLNEELANTSRQILDIEKKYDHTFKAIDSKRDKDLFDAQNVALFRREMDEADGFVKNMQRNLKAARMESDKYKKSLDKTTKTHELLSKQLTVTGKKYLGLSGNASDASRTMAKQQATARELTSLFDEQEAQVKALSAAFQKFKPMGIDKNLGKELNTALDQLKKLRDFASRKPITAKATLDKTQWDRKYAELMYDAEKLRAKLDRDHEVNVRVKVWEDNADKLEKRLNRLRHTRLDIPVEWQVDQERIIASMRETAAKIKANPERRWELEADLDLQMHRAEEKLKKFEDEHDEFKMDVDLETALARAHLAYFTRPRTIDIFAEFKGTDFGKIMKGMTTGATGIRGVQNQWQKLVNVFDRFDEVVPKWSMLGAIFTSVGAGALNLARTAGSAGASLVTMSKAALAAPGALLGVSAAFGAGYVAVSNYADYVDVASTKLGGLQKKLSDSFWSEAKQPVIDMMNALGGNGFVDGMEKVSSAEGKIAANAAKIVAQGEYVSRINSILGNTVKGVKSLNPGVQDVTKSVIRLGDMTSSYLPRMANYVSRNAAGMAQWVDEAEKSGKVTQAMEKAIEQGGYLMSSVKSLGGILRGTFGTLAEGENGIEKFSTQLQRADKAVNGVKFQSTIKAWADGAKDASSLFHDSFREIGDAAYSLRDTTKQVFVDAGSMVSTGIGSVSSMLGKSKTGIADFSNGVSEGFQKLFRSIDSAQPMFDSLLSMVGELSDTFGGTLENTLKSSAPTIKVLAEGASAAAKAFGKLPAPIQAMIGMYATFGKAGLSAYNSLKRGMLQNIEATLQYRKTLSQLGITSEETSISMRELVQAMARLKSGQTAGVLTGEASSIRELGSEADRTTAKLNRMHSAERGSSTVESGAVVSSGSSTIRRTAEEAETASRKVGLFRNAWSDVVDFLGGPVGIAIGGVTTALSLAGSAVSTYNEAAAHTQSVNQTVANSFKEASGTAKSASTAVAKARKTISKNWNDEDYGWNLPGGNAVEKFASGVQKWQSPFKKASDAAKTLNYSIKDLNGAATGSNATYDKMHDKLTKLANDHKYVVGAAGDVTDMNEKQTASATRLLGVLEDSREEWQKGEKAVANWVNSADSVTATSAAASDKLNLLSESLAANNFDLSENTKNGQANRKMMDDYANSALLAAKNIISAGNGSAEANQRAKNAIYSARQEIVQMGEQCGMTEEQANQLADQLGLIPDKVSTQFDVNNLAQTKAQVQDYIDMLPLTEGQRKIIFDLVDDKAITSMTVLRTAISSLMGGADEKDLRILLDAQDDASSKIKDVQSLAKSLGLTKKDIKILATDEAGPKLDAVKKKLQDRGLTDAQIKILIDALDKASGKMKDIEKQKVPAAKGVKFDIDANDNDASVKLAKYQGLNGSTLATAHTFVIGDDSSAQNAFNNTKAYDGVTLAQPWGRVLGEHALASLAFAAIEAFNGVTIARPWGRVMGNNDDARRAFRETRAYDGVTLARPWGRVIGDDSSAQSVFTSMKRLNGSVLATRYVDIITRKKGDGAVTVATGGRISGPGTGTSDSIPAWLSNGEAVLKASSLKKLDAKYGSSFFNTLNATGDVPAGSRIAKPSSTALEYRRQSLAYATGGRVEKMMSGAIEVNVQMPANTGTTVNQTFNTKVVRSNDDLYTAAPILHRNALAEARRYQR